MAFLCWREKLLGRRKGWRIWASRAVLVIFNFLEEGSRFHAEYPTMPWSIGPWLFCVGGRRYGGGGREGRRIWATRAVCGAGSHQSSASVSPGLKENVHKEKWNCRTSFVVPWDSHHVSFVSYISLKLVHPTKSGLKQIISFPGIWEIRSWGRSTKCQYVDSSKKFRLEWIWIV